MTRPTATRHREAGFPTSWEYTCVWASDESDEAELNRLGSEGWELVGVGRSERATRLFLKRPGLDFRERVTLEQKRRYYLQLGIELPSLRGTKENA